MKRTGFLGPMKLSGGPFICAYSQSSSALVYGGWWYKTRPVFLSLMATMGVLYFSFTPGATPKRVIGGHK